MIFINFNKMRKGRSEKGKKTGESVVFSLNKNSGGRGDSLDGTEVEEGIA